MNKNLNDQSEAARNLIHENRRNKILMITIIIAVALIAAIWIWKSIQMKNEREEAKREIKSVQDKASVIMIDSHKEHLKLLAKPYIWAIRNELLSGNINQVNVYANEMVKEKNFQSVTVANDKGVVISSTNKKNEGKPYSSIGKPELITGNSTIVENLNDSILIMSSPVMGFNNRLGTLVISYRVEKPRF